MFGVNGSFSAFILWIMHYMKPFERHVERLMRHETPERRVGRLMDGAWNPWKQAERLMQHETSERRVERLVHYMKPIY